MTPWQNQTDYTFGASQGTPGSGAVNPFSINSAYPGISLVGTEGSGQTVSWYEVAGNLWLTVNAVPSTTSGLFSCVSTGSPAYAIELDSSGNQTKWTSPATSGPISWVQVWTVDANGIISTSGPQRFSLLTLTTGTTGAHTIGGAATFGPNVTFPSSLATTGGTQTVANKTINASTFGGNVTSAIISASTFSGGNLIGATTLSGALTLAAGATIGGATLAVPQVTMFGAGSSVYTSPSGARWLIVEGVGSGGGGAGGTSANNGSRGSAGGYFRKLLTALATTYGYTVGAGGSGGSAGGNNGVAGNATTFGTGG